MCIQSCVLQNILIYFRNITMYKSVYNHKSFSNYPQYMQTGARASILPVGKRLPSWRARKKIKRRSYAEPCAGPRTSASLGRARVSRPFGAAAEKAKREKEVWAEARVTSRTRWKNEGVRKKEEWYKEHVRNNINYISNIRKIFIVINRKKSCNTIVIHLK